MTPRELIIKQLRQDEGSRAQAYQDHLGYWTIGVGRLIDARKQGSGLREVEIEFMLQNDIEDRSRWLAEELPWTATLDDARRGVLLNMSFQLGKTGLLNFKNTLALIRDGRYGDAANAMLQSLWAKQTPNRALRMANQMRTGEWQFQGG